MISSRFAAMNSFNISITTSIAWEVFSVEGARSARARTLPGELAAG
jgi:hypothetical protein